MEQVNNDLELAKQRAIEAWTRRVEQACAELTFWMHEYAKTGDDKARHFWKAHEVLLSNANDILEKFHRTTSFSDLHDFLPVPVI